MLYISSPSRLTVTIWCREKNIRELYQMGLIGRCYMILMLAFSRMKYVRRRLIRFADECRYFPGMLHERQRHSETK